MYGKCLLQSDLQSQKQALSIFEKCSSLGHSDADLQLSTMYENGVGCTKDLQKSSFYAKSSADKGNSNGAYAYAEHLWYGIGVPINEKLAVSYYKLASDLGFQEAHYKLWQIYHYGLGGIPIDETLALHYCKLGADSGHKQSLFNYGLSLAIGTEKVKKDIKESFKYFKECSEKFDDVQSTVNCAFILENEIKNIEEAAKYYKKAADLNSIDCCKYYSQMLELGKGVSKDLIESIFYYEKYTDLKRIETLMKANENWFYILKKEAEKGNSESAYILSKCYKYGYPDFILIEDNMNEKELELLKIAGNNISKKKSNERKKIKSHNLLTIASIGVLLFGVFSLRGFTK
ncbi:sel1 repeat family protein [Histomonas meleagridis]|uniref:sel1 repeat family protein n=1 Tax=Histomonas meleagridis TaxID=135588 RepID=UPI00355A8096|nr:sel1 repeat family protein [Histomonas meleagridis]KAH0801688.1 sel1 repeat family protein [Histomonas meleagridis]